jgi:iron complex outermembrane receptor protein
LSAAIIFFLFGINILFPKNIIELVSNSPQKTLCKTLESIHGVNSLPADSVIGKVVGENDNEPLIGVEVFIQGLNTGTTTNIDGNFEIRNLNKGTYSIRFSYLGYASLTKKVTIPSDEASNMIIRMKEAAINLNEIVVTGNPFLSETKDLSQATINLSALDLILKSGSTVGEELNFQPGVAVRSNGIATGRPVIRGFSNNKVLILEDGLRMGDLSNASDDHSISDDGNEPEKIEVLEGPSSLLYGSNAIGGVVNIITDAIPSSVQQGFNGELLTQGSTVNNEYLGSAHLNYGVGRFSFHGKLWKRKGQDYSIPGGEKTFNSDLDSYGSLLGLSVHPDWGMTGFSYTDYNNKYGLPTTPDADEIVYIDMHKKQYRLAVDVNNINAFLTSLSLKAGYLDYYHKEISRIDGAVGTSFGLKTKSADLSFAHIPLIKNSSGIIGFYGLIQNYDVVGEEALNPNADYASYAAYFLEKFSFENATFTFGARHESNNVKFPEATLSDSTFSGGENKFNSLSASLGIVYQISEATSFFTNVANAFRAPTIEELSSYAIHEAAASFDIGNRSLNKENTTGIDIGLRSQAENYNFEVTGYYNKVNNLIYRKPLAQFFSEDINPITHESIGFNTNGEGFRVHKYEQADAIVYGFESKLNYELLKGFTTTLVSDYVRAKNQTTDENISQIPPFRFLVELRYATPRYWLGATLNLVAAQKDVAPNEEPTAGYGIVGIYGGVKLLTGEYAHILNLKINNLFDQRYRDHLSAIKDFTFMPGRNIQLTYKFLF